MKKNGNITLIGMAGVGKSTIGKELAQDLSFDFLDVDDLIKTQDGLETQPLIDKLGEEGFLRKEEETILSLRGISRTVIAPGGSCIYSQRAMDFLKKVSLIIFLHSSYEAIKRRIPDLDTRGIVSLKKKGLKQLYKERLLLYQHYADKTVTVPDDFDVNSIVADIKSLLKESV